MFCLIRVQVNDASGYQWRVRRSTQKKKPPNLGGGERAREMGPIGSFTPPLKNP
jgi:hypothetical protein